MPSTLLNNLISYWKLDETSGAALDARGTNPLPVYDGGSGSLGTAAGKVGTARQFSGTFIFKLPSGSEADFRVGPGGHASYTFAAWVYFDGAGAGGVVGKGAASSAATEFDLYRYADGNLYSDIGGGEQIGAGPISAGVWHYVVVGFDGGSQTMYVQVDNGTPFTRAAGRQLTAGTSDLLLGSVVGTGQSLQGRMDEAGYWSRWLTGAERVELYNGGAGLAYPFAPPAIVPRLWLPGRAA